jgi:hypothetical protein
MNTTRHGTEGTEAQTKQPFLNLPLMLTIGAMILLGITTVTLGFLLRPEPTQWPETMETTSAPAGAPATETTAEPGAETTAEPGAETTAEPGAETTAEPGAETTADQPGADAAPGPDGQGLPRPDGPARLP